jgi:hypothetical protein
MMSTYKMIGPDDKLDFNFDWSAWMAASDTISTSVWAVTPSGPTLTGDGETATTTQIYLSVAAWGETYTLTNTITTANGTIAERSYIVRCGSR